MVYGTFIEAVGEFSREINFLSRAVSKNKTEYVVRHILIEPSDTEAGKFRGVSTDGRRLHIVDPLSAPENAGLEAGNWMPLKKNRKCSWMARVKEDKGQFPAYRRIIPKDEPLFTFTLPCLPSEKDVRATINLVDFFRKFPDPTAIRMNYLNDLDHFCEWKVKWYGGDKAVLFESGGYTALIITIDWNMIITTGQ